MTKNLKKGYNGVGHFCSSIGIADDGTVLYGQGRRNSVTYFILSRPRIGIGRGRRI